MPHARVFIEHDCIQSAVSELIDDIWDDSQKLSNKLEDYYEKSSQAKTTADSIMAIVKASPSKFVSLLDFSADTVSNEKEGVLDWFVYNSMVPEFRDFCFENETGAFGVVESPFGLFFLFPAFLKDIADFDNYIKDTKSRMLYYHIRFSLK